MGAAARSIQLIPDRAAIAGVAPITPACDGINRRLLELSPASGAEAVDIFLHASGDGRDAGNEFAAESHCISSACASLLRCAGGMG